MNDSAAVERITRNPAILAGKPIVRGTRISVALIADWVTSGQTPAQIVDDYPVLTEEDIAAAVAFAQREQERTEVATW